MKNIFKILGLSLTSFLLAKNTLAFCPVCTIAVGAGVGFSRWLGIDDTISGVWVGGLTVSISMWTVNWLKKKNVKFKGRTIATLAFYYALIVVPLYFMGIIGHPYNRIWGMDKLVLGVVVGSIIFALTGAWYQYLKKRNGGHAHFPMQKVAMPLASLIILSFVFYFLTK